MGNVNVTGLEAVLRNLNKEISKIEGRTKKGLLKELSGRILETIKKHAKIKK